MDKFDLEIEIENEIEFHNFRILKITGFKPLELRIMKTKNYRNCK